MTILLRQKPLPRVVRQIVQRDNGAWFDPEDLSTMFQDAAGTTPVTALEQPVGRWLDKSGNGNHATQSITASRPTLSARYNLLTKTEDFANAAWVKRGTAVLGSTAPDGTGKLISGLRSSGNDIYQYATVPTGVSATPQIEIWPVTITGVLRMLNPVNSLNGLMDIDLSKLTAGVWNKITPTHPAVTTVNSFTGYGEASGIHLYGKDNLSVSAYFRFPQLTIGTTPLPYQRVNTATDYDSVGWPRYLRGDGIDDFYNLPFMNLYGNGSCSIVAARDAISQATDTYIISERSTTDVDPKYFPSRQLASGGNMDSYIVSDEGTVRLDTTGSAFSGAKLAAIRSVVDSGSNIKLFKDGAVVADDNYTRAGTLTLNNTTLGASSSTTTSNYANMRLYGIIITKSALSDTDRRRCEQFLASRLSTLGVTLS